MLARLRTEGAIVLAPALPVVALFAYWAAAGGGYMPTTWLPSALLVLGLVVATVAGLRVGRIRLTRPALVALVALAAYAAWSYASILWAPAPADALEGSDRTLLYLLLFALFAVLPWRPWTAVAALTAFALGVGAIALAQLIRLGRPDVVPGMFVDGRLDAPTGYVNGTAALFMVGALVGVAVAAQRPLPWPLRGPLLALATACLQAAVLTGSRGWLFTLPIVAALALALMPGRVRLTLWALPAIGATLLALPELLDVFARTDAAPDVDRAHAALRDAAGAAATAALRACAAVLVVGTLMALVDRRVAPPPTVVRAARHVGAALLVVAVAAGIAATLAATDGRPDRWVADYWDRSSGYQPTEPGTSRFLAVGSNRPDFWRVALDAFAERPLTGLGQDNWGDYYLRARESDEQPRWTHSVQLRLLAHTGVVGLLLFAAFAAAALAAALARRRVAPRALTTAQAICALPAVVWLVHGSLDWFWEIPALSGPTFAFLGCLVALSGAVRPAGARAGEPADDAAAADDARDARPATAGRRLARRAAIAGAAAATVAAAAALALPYAADRAVEQAGAEWGRDPDRALAQLARAERLNRLDPRPALVGGVIAFELDRLAEARRRLERALARERDDWFAHLLLGLVLSAERDRATARAHLERARTLNPRAPLIDRALRRLDGPRPVSRDEAFAALRRGIPGLAAGRGGFQARYTAGMKDPNRLWRPEIHASFAAIRHIQE